MTDREGVVWVGPTEELGSPVGSAVMLCKKACREFELVSGRLEQTAERDREEEAESDLWEMCSCGLSIWIFGELFHGNCVLVFCSHPNLNNCTCPRWQRKSKCHIAVWFVCAGAQIKDYYNSFLVRRLLNATVEVMLICFMTQKNWFYFKKVTNLKVFGLSNRCCTDTVVDVKP